MWEIFSIIAATALVVGLFALSVEFYKKTDFLSGYVVLRDADLKMNLFVVPFPLIVYCVLTRSLSKEMFVLSVIIFTVYLFILWVVDRVVFPDEKYTMRMSYIRPFMDVFSPEKDGNLLQGLVQSAGLLVYASFAIAVGAAIADHFFGKIDNYPVQVAIYALMLPSMLVLVVRSALMLKLYTNKKIDNAVRLYFITPNILAIGLSSLFILMPYVQYYSDVFSKLYIPFTSVILPAPTYLTIALVSLIPVLMILGPVLLGVWSHSNYVKALTTQRIEVAEGLLAALDIPPSTTGMRQGAVQRLLNGLKEAVASGGYVYYFLYLLITYHGKYKYPKKLSDESTDSKGDIYDENCLAARIIVSQARVVDGLTEDQAREISLMLAQFGYEGYDLQKNDQYETFKPVVRKIAVSLDKIGDELDVMDEMAQHIRDLFLMLMTLPGADPVRRDRKHISRLHDQAPEESDPPIPPSSDTRVALEVMLVRLKRELQAKDKTPFRFILTSGTALSQLPAFLIQLTHTLPAS